MSKRLDEFLGLPQGTTCAVDAADAAAQDADTFANAVMPSVKKMLDCLRTLEGCIGNFEDASYHSSQKGYEKMEGFEKSSADKLQAACYEAIVALKKIKTVRIA